jgi:sulfonate transport system ATP-binding protein
MTRRLVELSVEEKAFHGKTVIAGVEFQIYDGEIVSAVGPSGCGKSTLRIISGLDTDYHGLVNVLGRRPQLHARDVGLIFQEPRLLPWLTVADNVGFDLGRRGGKHPRVRDARSVPVAVSSGSR